MISSDESESCVSALDQEFTWAQTLDYRMPLSTTTNGSSPFWIEYFGESATGALGRTEILATVCGPIDLVLSNGQRRGSLNIQIIFERIT
jgi:hypothetical protein